MATKKFRTPFIKPRTQGGSFYTFASAMEDIGLNINETKNKVALSHYVLLDLPVISGNGSTADEIFANEFQNYVLNMETLMRNQDGYSIAASKTVSERVFWKWLKKKGAVSFTQREDGYYEDDKKIAKAFGLITSGSQRTDDYSMYNETFVQIPSSLGQMEVIYKKYQDGNYYASSDVFETASDNPQYIENIDPDDANGGTLFTGLSCTPIYDSENGYTISDDECMEVEFSIDKLREIYDNEYLTYDKLAIDDEYTISRTFSFNAVLVYYSIYDSTGKNILATNTYGILLLGKGESTEGGCFIPQLTKIQTTADTDGTSYAFRVNMKTSSVYNGDILVCDNSTPSFDMSTDFNDVIKNLNTAVNMLKSNANLMYVISSDNQSIKNLTMTAIDKINELERQIGTIQNVAMPQITVDHATISTMDSDITFLNTAPNDYENTVCGTMSGDTFQFENMKANTLSTTEIHSDRICINGYSQQGTTQQIHQMTEDEATSILNSINVVRTEDGYRIQPSPDIANSDGSIDLNAVLGAIIKLTL